MTSETQVKLSTEAMLGNCAEMVYTDKQKPDSFREVELQKAF